MRRRIVRFLYGPRPFDGVAGAIRGGLGLFVAFFALSSFFDYIADTTTGRAPRGLVAHVISALFFAVMISIFLMWNRSQKRR